MEEKPNIIIEPDCLPWIDDDNYLVYWYGEIYSKCSGKFLSKQLINGYYAVSIRGPTKRKILKVHRMVATMFCLNPDNKPIVDHIDQNRLNNKYVNLRWVSYLENAENTRNLETRNRSVKQYDINMNFLAEFKSIKSASELTGMSYACIKNCCRGVYNTKKVLDNVTGIYYIWKYSYINTKISTPENSKVISGYQNYHVTKEGNVYSLNLGNFLTPLTDKSGYLLVALYKDAKSVKIPIHRLVAEAFTENIPENYKELYVNHIDGNPSNNHIDNLEYTTPQENSFHSCRVLGNIGKQVKMYDDNTGELINIFPSSRIAAESLGKTYVKMSDICLGKSKLEGITLKYE